MALEMCCIYFQFFVTSFWGFPWRKNIVDTFWYVEGYTLDIVKKKEAAWTLENL